MGTEGRSCTNTATTTDTAPAPPEDVIKVFLASEIVQTIRT